MSIKARKIDLANNSVQLKVVLGTRLHLLKLKLRWDFLTQIGLLVINDNIDKAKTEMTGTLATNIQKFPLW